MWSTQCSQRNVALTDDWINAVSGDGGLVPPSNKPLPEQMLTKFHDALWRFQGNGIQFTIYTTLDTDRVNKNGHNGK